MPKTFNTAGPCRPGKHYMLPPERRLGRIRPLIELEAFFVVHAPRQSGKTTSFSSLAQTLTAEGHYAAVHVSCKPAASSGDDLDHGIGALITAIVHEARYQLPEELQPAHPAGPIDSVDATFRLRAFLASWCQFCPRPVVLFLDEFDALADRTLQSTLDQLHSGYTARPAPFPHSLALIGLRDVRDYEVGPDKRRLGTASPFNIKLESLRLRDFTAEEVAELYAQHETDTGQAFDQDAVARAYEWTRGQPWLVNALARQAVEQEVPKNAGNVTLRHIDAAKEALILRRDTHIDSLVQRLREPRVRRVIEPILAGVFTADEVLDDDIEFTKDLGLVARGPGGLEIANPLYREIVPRALTAGTESQLAVNRAPYISPNGQLLFARLIEGFADFWRLHAESFLHKQPYSEAAAQLIFMAWLQRVVNGGSPAGPATIDREYAVGSGRIDICVRWPLPAGKIEVFAVELKVWRPRAVDPLGEGLDQLASYLERLNLPAGFLLIFDRRSETPEHPDRVENTELEHRGRTITLWRL